MSLLIDPRRVVGILLADGWHEVATGKFYLDSYEFVYPPEGGKGSGNYDIVHGGGNNGICATGFSYEPAEMPGTRVAGPLTSILAVMHQPERG